MAGSVSFQFTEADLREAYRADAVARTTAGGSVGAKGRLVAGWLLFIAVTAVVYAVMQDRVPSQWRDDLLLPMIPWLLVFAFTWFFVVRVFRTPRRPWRGRQGVVPVTPTQGVRALRPFLGLGLFVVIGGVLFAIVKLYAPSATPAVASPPPADFTPLIYWAAMFVVVWLVVYLGLKRAPRRRWEMLPQWHRPYTAQFDDQALVMAEPYSRVQYSWEYFEGFLETPNLFMLYSSPLVFHMLPKRAFADDAGRAEFRELLRRHIAERENAFPVIPLAKKRDP